jgi:hypothetical protein
MMMMMIHGSLLIFNHLIPVATRVGHSILLFTNLAIKNLKCKCSHYPGKDFIIYKLSYRLQVSWAIRQPLYIKKDSQFIVSLSTKASTHRKPHPTGYPRTVDLIRDAKKGTTSRYTFYLADRAYRGIKVHYSFVAISSVFRICVMRKLFEYFHCYVIHDILITYYTTIRCICVYTLCVLFSRLLL